MKAAWTLMVSGGMVLIAVVVAGCAATVDGGRAGGHQSAVRSAVERIQAEGDARRPMVDEWGYRSLEEMSTASPVIVIAHPASAPVPMQPGFDWVTPAARQTFEVEKVIKGDSVPPRIDLVVGGSIVGADIDYRALKLRSWSGRIETTYDRARTYLLYLSRSAGVFTPTSVLSGTLPEVAGVGFVKPTSDNPGIPDVVTEAMARQAS